MPLFKHALQQFFSVSCMITFQDLVSYTVQNKCCGLHDWRWQSGFRPCPDIAHLCFILCNHTSEIKLFHITYCNCTEVSVWQHVTSYHMNLIFFTNVTTKWTFTTELYIYLFHNFVHFCMKSSLQNCHPYYSPLKREMHLSFFPFFFSFLNKWSHFFF